MNLPCPERTQALVAPLMLAPALLLAAMFALPAYGQGYATLGTGQAVFIKAGCDGCHSYVSRRAAPSVRDLMRDFEGEPVDVAAATRAARAHRKDARFPDLAESDMRLIAQWLGQITWPEDETETLDVAAPLVPEAPAAVTIKNTSRVAVASIHLTKGPARSDRLIVALKGGEPDMIDIQKVDDRLVVTFFGARLGDDVAPRLDSFADSRVVSAIESTEQEKSVELSIDSRVAAWTYTGRQGKSNLTIELIANARQPQPVVAAAAPAPKPAATTLATPVAKASAPKQAAAAKAAPPQSTAASAASATTGVAGSAASAAMATSTVAGGVATAPAAAVVPAAAVAATAPATKAAAQPPTRLALAKPSITPAPVVTEPRKERGKATKYRDGADLDPCPPSTPADQVIGQFDADQVKEIMDRIGCPQCHAYVQKKTGPPFRDILRKYKGDPACVIHRLRTNETHKDEGITRDIAPQEFKLLADYVASRFLK